MKRKILCSKVFVI